MPVLWTFNFDSPCYFNEAEYMFEFEGREYRLIRGTDEECDKLLTITDDYSPDECIERVMRLLDFLSWTLKVGIQFLGGVSHGIKKGTLTLETAPIGFLRKRKLIIYGVDISSIPEVKNDVQIDALSLWNEAEISTSPFLGFINYWKIVELFPHGTKPKGSPEERAIDWVDNVNTNKIINLDKLKKAIAGKEITVGKFLYNECRNAIAHITRKPTLKPSKVEDHKKISLPKQVMRALAKYYMETQLGLGGYHIPLKILKTKSRTKALKEIKEREKEERKQLKETISYIKRRKR